MKYSNCLLAILFMIAATLGWTSYILAAPLDDLIAAAKKEGALNLHAPSTLGPQGSAELIAAFNKKYGPHIRVNYIPSSSFTTDIARVISQSALGVAPEYDLMLVSDNHHASLWSRRLHLTFDYKALGVDPKAIQHDNGSVMIAHGIVLPAYNHKILNSKDVPRRWEDFLDPKWKDGKLGTSTSTHYFGRLAAGPWGEEKTTKFVKGLAGQRPFLGRLAELYTRLQLGEILMAVPMADSMIGRARKEGAPITFTERIEPVPMTANSAGVLKGAAHPNAGHLFAAFMTTLEAQEIWERHFGQTSAFVPGTANHKFAQGKQVLYMHEKDAELVEKLATEYSKILGFTR